MNLFVNDQKRELELPDGCIDLVEMLQPARREPESTSIWRRTHDLQELERLLATLLLSPSTLRNLSISISKADDRLELMHVKGSLRLMLVLSNREPRRLESVRGVIRSNGVKSLREQSFLYGGTPLAWVLCPLPASAPDAADFIVRILRDGFELEGNAELTVGYRESRRA